MPEHDEEAGLEQRVEAVTKHNKRRFPTLGLFRALAERVKALFITNLALDLEAEFLERSAERKAKLLQWAERHEAEGYHQIAHELRQQAHSMHHDEPLGAVLRAFRHLGVEPQESRPLLPMQEPNNQPVILKLPNRKKGRQR